MAQMDVVLKVHVEAPQKPSGGKALAGKSKAVAFTAPQELVAANFPAAEANFDFPCSVSSGAIPDYAAAGDVGAAIVRGFCAERRNSVVMAYGARGTSKREAVFGTSAKPTTGLAPRVLKQVVAKAPPTGGVRYEAVCFGTDGTDSLVDLLDLNNSDAIIAESAREGPRLANLTRLTVASDADVQRLATTVTASYEKRLSAVLAPPAGPEEQAMPNFDGLSIGLVFYKYDSAEAAEARTESNALHFYALGDCERPVLCGVDTEQLDAYERAQRILAACLGIVSAIRCSRLRIPFGKTKVSAMMKRVYNSEKNYQLGQGNQPTATYALFHCLDDAASAEESFHVLTAARRAASTVGGAVIGPPTRDLAAEKWRIEQDIVELKEELAVAKSVFDYRPVIFDQAKPVTNIQEEEKKRTDAIVRRRQEAKERAREEMKAKAQAEAAEQIARLEKEAGVTLAGLQESLRRKREENTALQAERQKKMADYTKQLEKIKRKKEEEEGQVEALRSEIATLEADLASRRQLIGKKQQQLDVASADQAKGREAVLKERDDLRRERAALYERRRQERAGWLSEIRQTNDKLLGQARALEKLRKERLARGGSADAAAAEESEEEAVRRDIEAIDEYLPKLISLDDVPADAEAADSIRKQLEEYFAQERDDYKQKVAAEQQRLAAVQKQVDEYRGKVAAHQERQKKELLQEAMRKRSHLLSLVDQVIQYLQHGLRMYKVSSTRYVRRRFFYLSDNCKCINATELGPDGMPLSRRKPSTTIYLKDVRRVVLGVYTPSFVNFAGGDQALRPQREEALRDTGSYSADTTAPLTSQNVGRYNYRAFAFELANGKTLELVCETDSDCEAWLVALKRLFHFRTRREAAQDRQAGGTPREQQCAFVWGAPLDVESRRGVDKLSAHERDFCRQQHVPPLLFLKAKEAAVAKAKTALVTAYDVRMAATLDLLRAQFLHEFLIESNVIPPDA